MDKTQASAILRLCSQPEWPVLEDYLKGQLQVLHKELELCKPERLGQMQGQCQHINDMLSLAVKARNF